VRGSVGKSGGHCGHRFQARKGGMRSSGRRGGGGATVLDNGHRGGKFEGGLRALTAA